MRRDPAIANIAIQGDVQKGLAYIPLAKALLRRTLERARVGNLETLSDQQRFDDNAYAYVVVAHGVNAIRIVVGPEVTESARIEDVVDVEMPDFLSGAVRTGYIEERQIPVPGGEPLKYEVLLNFDGTPRCDSLHDLPGGLHEQQRLAVRPWPAFELDNKRPPPVFSQYTVIKPTMYSGLMRRVVQLVMGFGKQSMNGDEEISVYTDHPDMPQVERADYDSKYQRQTRESGVQVRYDWRFVRTHGVVAVGSHRWLVEIGLSRGVIAMPLPEHPFARTEEFAQIVDDVGDTDMRRALEELGCLPTGEAFPAGDSFDSWVRAGRVVRVLPPEALAEFYSHNSYSSAMGWAFNLSGTEAHNTAWRYGEDYIQRGVHYMIGLQGGSISEIEPRTDIEELRRRFDALRKDDARKDRVDAVMWKLDRLSDSQIGQVKDERSDEEAFDTADGFTLAPIGSFNASISKVSEGYLWWMAEFRQVIKFAEPELGYLLSHRMPPKYGFVGEDKRCDTTMHVFFRGNELKWVKYFRDPRSVPGGQQESDEEECMYVGAWTKVDTTGPQQITTMFYTNDFDDRDLVPGSVTTRRTTGTSMGYTAIQCGDDPSAPYLGNCTRTKTFLLCTETETVRPGGFKDVGIAVPFHDREAYYYAVAETQLFRSFGYQCGYVGLADPWSCNTWRNFPGWTGFSGGGVYVRAEHPDGCGPVDARTAATPSPNYNAGPCSDFADSGPWCFPCDNMDLKVFSASLPPVPPSISYSEGQKTLRSVYLVSNYSESPVKCRQHSVDPIAGLGRWEQHSPDQFGFTDYIEETQNALGDGTDIVFDRDLNGAAGRECRTRFEWAESGGGVTFIGVID